MLKARFDSLSGDGITSSYTGFGELTSSTITMSGLSRTLAYAYDKENKRVELTHHDGQKFTYVRDGLGRANNIYEGTSQVSTAQLIQSSFNNAGQLALMQRATTGSAFLGSFTYDPIGRLASLAGDALGTANDLTISQSFNPGSQIISQTRSNDAYSWTGSVAVNRNYTTNGLNQYTAAGPASFTYDANGNLTSDGSTAYLYDIENRLVSATGGNAASLTYDPMGRLEQITGTGTDTRFHYDGDELVAEYDSTGTLARRFVHSDNVDDPVVQYDGATIGASYRSFLMPDERGSIVGLFYNDGTARAKNTYDEYGIPGAANQGRFQYTGQAWITELGMYHYKARIYSPTLGRFLQVDPIGYKDQYNLYAYVGDDPVNATDPTGLYGDQTDCTGSRLCSGQVIAGGASGSSTATPTFNTRNQAQSGNSPSGQASQSSTGQFHTASLAGGTSPLDCLTPQCVSLIPPTPMFLIDQINKHDGLGKDYGSKPSSVFSSTLQNPGQAQMAILTVMNTAMPVQVGGRLVYSGFLPYVTGFDRDGTTSHALTVVVALTGARDIEGQRIVRLHSFYPGFPSNIYLPR